MIDTLSKLTVLHDDNNTFKNHTEKAADYLRDTFSLDLSSTEDYLYLGFVKPFNTCYVAFTTANTEANELSAEYYNGTSWVSLDLTDETLGFTRSGFLFWDKTNMKAVTINGLEKYYIRIRPSADHDAETVVRGINLLFADDNALKQEFYDIDNESLLPAGETSQLVHHVGARNSLIQMLRNKGYMKQSSGSSALKQITQWDIMDVFQVKEAAVMLTLSKIFFTLSDSKDDTWWAKYTEYQDKFEEAFKLVLLSIDQNDDGIDDVQETNEPFKVQRWLR
jgi:hypothetical protein